MKKIIAFVCTLCLLFSVTANAEYTQNDIYTAVNTATQWMEKNASPLNVTTSSASDYYIMALSKLGKEYDYGSYVNITEKINPSTKQDGQRLIMSNTACNERLADSFVGIYTYNANFESASDIAGAVITLKSCGYEIKKDNYNFNRMIAELLQMQQSNGSFNNDVLTTAKAIIALSYFPGLNFKIAGAHDNESYSYSTDNAILNAVTFLESNLNSENGYSTVMSAAYAIIALDSVGIDADNDIAFSSGGKSLISYLLSMQQSDGSFNGSADDTSISVCALTSHLLSMQGKTSFFNFTDGIKADSPLDGENFSASGIVSDINNNEQTTEEITVNPLPTNEPEHSAFTEEEYGPYPFVGPSEASEQSDAAPENITEEEQSNSLGVIVAVLVMGLCAAGIVLIYIKKKRESKNN